MILREREFGESGGGGEKDVYLQWSHMIDTW